MREAVIVSTPRTPIGKASRGAFNNTLGQSLGGHAIKHAVQRAGVDAAEVEDVIMGAALQMGSNGHKVVPRSRSAAGRRFGGRRGPIDVVATRSCSVLRARAR